MIPQVKLGDLAESMDSGFACAKSKLVAEGLPHLRPFNVGRSGEIDLSEVYHVPIDVAPEGKRTLRAGDILFNNTNSRDLVGKVAYVPRDMEAGYSNHVTRLRVDDGLCEPQFVAIYLRRLWARGFFRDQCTQWVSQAAFGPRLLADVPVPLPALEEQRRIVDILNRAASIERLRAQASAHLRALVPALFIKMFGDPLENPMGWEVRPLGDVVRGFQGGKNVQAGSGASPYRILKVSAVTSGSFDPEESKSAPDGYDPPSEHLVRAGDLLFSRANTSVLVGATAMVESDSPNILLPDKLWRVVWRQPSAVEPTYLHHFLQMPSTRTAISALATGTSASMQNISQAKLKTLPVLIPPLENQRQYTRIVEGIRAVRTAATAASNDAGGLSNSLMSRLFGTA